MEANVNVIIRRLKELMKYGKFFGLCCMILCFLGTWAAIIKSQFSLNSFMLGAWFGVGVGSLSMYLAAKRILQNKKTGAY